MGDTPERKKSIEVIEVDLSEFAKGGGGPTCLTLPLIRDELKLPV